MHLERRVVYLVLRAQQQALKEKMNLEQVVLAGFEH
jgi:hypothetical protein